MSFVLLTAGSRVVLFMLTSCVSLTQGILLLCCPLLCVGVGASVQGLREDKFACVKLDHLQPQQLAQLLSLLDGFRVVFDERPGKTTVVEHRIELVPNARPVKQV